MLTQVTPRGQITLPAEIRKTLGLEPGSAVDITVEENHIVVQPVITLPVRIYSEEDLAMFDEAQRMSTPALDNALENWGVRGAS